MLKASIPQGIYLDNGGLFSQRPQRRTKKNAETGIEILAAMHCKALNIGIEELEYGPSFLHQTARKYGLPLVSTNLRHKDGTSPSWINESLILPIHGNKIAVLGIIKPLPTATAQPGLNDLVRQDPAKALQKALAKLDNKNIDFVILLSRLNSTETFALVDQFPQINMAISRDTLQRKVLTTDSGQKIMRGGKNCSNFRSALLRPLDDGSYAITPQATRSLRTDNHDKTIDRIIEQGM